MCLSKIIKTGLDESGIGWKIFSTDIDDRLKSCYYDWKHKSGYEENKWQIAELGQNDLKYIAGFHVYLQCPEILSRIPTHQTLRKVHYRKGHTLGIDCDALGSDIKTIVASEMLILKEGDLIDEM